MSNISITNPSGGSSPMATAIQFVQGNDSVNVPPNPVTFIWLLLGDNTQGVDVTGNAGTYTSTITMSDATTSQKGVLELASNAETIAGTNTTKATTPDDIKAKLGAQTSHGLAYGAGTTSAIAWLGEATNGQIPIGQTGGVPILGNILSADGSVVITNSAGGIDLSVANEVAGTGTTIGATTANILTVPLGGSPGTFQLEARVKGFESTGPAGCGYNITSTFTTDGLAATLVGNQPVFNEDPSLADADAYFIASGNNAVLQVLGVIALTISWTAETEIT